MARLTILAFVGLGIIAALLLLPRTSWVVKNDLAYLEGGTPGRNFYGLLEPGNWPTGTDSEELAQAIQQETLHSGDSELGGLERYCQSHPNDPAGWGFLSRMATMTPLRSPLDTETAKVSGEYLRKREHRLVSLRMAIDNGKRLEPDNAYYSLLDAALLECRGKHAEAQQAIIDGSRKTQYNDYVVDQSDLVYRTLIARTGYRGTALNLAVKAGVLLPHLASIMSTLTFAARDAKGRPLPDVQTAGMRMAHMIGRKTDNPITVICMKSLFQRLAMNQVKGVSVAPDKIRERVAALKSPELGADLKDFEQVLVIDDTIKQMTADFDAAVEPPVLAGGLLLALMLGLPAALIALGVSSLKRRRSKNPEALRARPWLWCGWAVVICLALSALCIGLFKSRSDMLIGYEYFGTTSSAAYTCDPSLVAFFAAITLCVAVVFVPRRAPSLGIALAAIYAVLPILYLGMIVKELRLDQTIMGHMVSIGNETDRVRGNWR